VGCVTNFLQGVGLKWEQVIVISPLIAANLGNSWNLIAPSEVARMRGDQWLDSTRLLDKDFLTSSVLGLLGCISLHRVMPLKYKKPTSP